MAQGIEDRVRNGRGGESDIEECLRTLLCLQAGSRLHARARPARAILADGGGLHLFITPAGGKHIGRESIEKVYRVTLGLDGKHSPHGWRSAFSILARDNGFARDVVELALDHAHDNEVARAYDRGERFAQRVELFAWWGRQLASAQCGAQIIPLTKPAELVA